MTHAQTAKGEKVVIVRIILSPEEHESLVKSAKEEGRTVAGEARWAIKKYCTSERYRTPVVYSFAQTASPAIVTNPDGSPIITAKTC